MEYPCLPQTCIGPVEKTHKLTGTSNNMVSNLFSDLLSILSEIGIFSIAHFSVTTFFLIILIFKYRWGIYIYRWLRHRVGLAISMAMDSKHNEPENEPSILKDSIHDFSDDIPITLPAQDELGVNPLAKSIALRIRSLQNPTGSVIAVYGPWGSGKSSTVHLILHYLKEWPDTEREQSPTIVEFKSWSYRTEDGVVSGFFQELYSGLKPTLSRSWRARMAFKRIELDASNSNSVPSVIESIKNTISGNIFGLLLLSILYAVIYLLPKLVMAIYRFMFGAQNGHKVESRHDILNAALEDCEKPLLLVIDDIDRLSPEEALVIFRIIKSVGRLRNVIYLLSYDRVRVERLVKKKYPSEGIHYLEKIVQVGFDIPQPDRGKLVKMLKSNLNRLFDDAANAMTIRSDSVLQKMVFPEIRTPRDVHRLTNMLTITFPAIREKVNVADFLAVESLCLFHPSIYHAIRTHRYLLTGARKYAQMAYDEAEADNYRNAIIGDTLEGDDKERIQVGLTEIFPILNKIWNNGNYSYKINWESEHRVCTDSSFDIYFGLFSGTHTVTQATIRDIAKNASNSSYIKDVFQRSINIIENDGRTRVSIILDELGHYGDLFDPGYEEAIVRTLFSVADDFEVIGDEIQGTLSPENNRSRLLRAARNLLYSKHTPTDSHNIVVAACSDASLVFSVYVFEVFGTEKDPYSDDLLISEDQLKQFKNMILERIHNAHASDTLLNCKNPLYVLARWRSMLPSHPNKARSCIMHMLTVDKNIIKICREFCNRFSYKNQMWIDNIGDESIYFGQTKEVYDMLEDVGFRQVLEYAKSIERSKGDRDLIQSTISIWDRIVSR